MNTDSTKERPIILELNKLAGVVDTLEKTILNHIESISAICSKVEENKRTDMTELSVPEKGSSDIVNIIHKQKLKISALIEDIRAVDERLEL